ncbi:ATP-binding protein [Methanoplanus limicola]|uniref:ATPase n=1 Tax=Methanoplanus limicola DSM 2279 TaxID=937775 RepID=H1Z015_9EURY|nr:ATP-binding protein [Methanoplanus limicola]EHQ35222.1 ATPase [Methanoplanus limicola DSM 2279]
MSQQKSVPEFVDRNDEMEFLTGHYNSRIPELIIIYGRRRVGKTTLISRFLKNRPGFYFMASEEGRAGNIRDFADVAGDYLKDPDFKRTIFPDWQVVLKSLVSHRNFSPASGERVIIVIDEFSYLISKDKGVPSAFQKIWDLILSDENIMLILSGSSVSTMETEVLGYKSPLYGRRTGQWQVEPLFYPYLREFLPYREEELVMVWSVIGGVPAYLRFFNPDTGLWENILQQMLSKGSYLYLEAEILLHYEFREAGNYISILRALSSGFTNLSSVCQETGLDKSMVSKYLSVLTGIHLIADEIPVTAHAGYRKRHYRILDPYLNFWFAVVYPHRMDIETKKGSDVLESVKAELPPYFGKMFENLCMELVRNSFFFEDMYFSKLGRWWFKENEIDIVGFDESSEKALFCECKWVNLSEKKARGILKSLTKKAPLVEWKNQKRSEVYGLIAKEISGKENMRAEGYQVFDLEDLRELSRPYLSRA